MHLTQTSAVPKYSLTVLLSTAVDFHFLKTAVPYSKRNKQEFLKVRYGLQLGSCCHWFANIFSQL